MAQQPWEAEQRLRVEGTEVTTYTSTQLNAEFRAIENDASENDEFCQIRMQEFAIQDEEATDSQKRSPCGFPRSHIWIVDPFSVIDLFLHMFLAAEKPSTTRSRRNTTSGLSVPLNTSIFSSLDN